MVAELDEAGPVATDEVGCLARRALREDHPGQRRIRDRRDVVHVVGAREGVEPVAALRGRAQHASEGEADRDPDGGKGQEGDDPADRSPSAVARQGGDEAGDHAAEGAEEEQRHHGEHDDDDHAAHAHPLAVGSHPSCVIADRSGVDGCGERASVERHAPTLLTVRPAPRQGFGRGSPIGYHRRVVRVLHHAARRDDVQHTLLLMGNARQPF